MRKWMTTGGVLIAALGGIAACTSSSDSCLAEGTLVSTPEGLRAIETLKAGDFVLVADPRARRPRTRRILEVVRHELRETFVIDAASSHMRVTGEHRVWVASREAWLEADKILVGDVVCVIEGGIVREQVVEDLRRDKECVAVFDLSLDGPERTFFADGILVHNMSWPPSCDSNSPYYSSESPCDRRDGDWRRRLRCRCR
jgi:hypothetical protein